MKRTLIAVTFMVAIAVGATGVFIGERMREVNAVVLAASSFSPPDTLRNAVLAAEELTDASGASITDQLVRSVRKGAPRRQIVEQLQNILVRVALDIRFTDDQILAAYMQNVYLGRESYGVENGASAYFGKSSDQLTVAESALLAGLIRGPSRFAPSKEPERALERRNQVLSIMLERQFISQQEFEVASREPLHVRG